MRIGLIGLGNAGQALAQALSRHAALHVHDRDPERIAALAAICEIRADARRERRIACARVRCDPALAALARGLAGGGARESATG